VVDGDRAARVILDTSAVVAILLKEPGFEELLQSATEGDDFTRTDLKQPHQDHDSR